MTTPDNPHSTAHARPVRRALPQDPAAEKAKADRLKTDQEADRRRREISNAESMARMVPQPYPLFATSSSTPGVVYAIIGWRGPLENSTPFLVPLGRPAHQGALIHSSSLAGDLTFSPTVADAVSVA